MQSTQARDALIKALAPRSVIMSMQVWQDNYVRSSNTEYPIAQASNLQRLLYASGFNPTMIDRQYAATSMLWEKENKARKKVQEMGKAWADNVRAGRDNTDLINRMILEGLPVDSVMRSANARLARFAEDKLQIEQATQRALELQSITRR